MFYTFLPVLWDDLKDGEFLFRKEREKRKTSFTCDVNLDTASLGRLSVSVKLMDSSFYITFYTERRETGDLINARRHVLERRFASQGLNLKAVNFSSRKNISFGSVNNQGINVTI